MRHFVFFIIFVFFVSPVWSAPVVVDANGEPDPNFIVEKIMPRIDGQIPRLEAARNLDYGTGVFAASIKNGILSVYKIDKGNYELFATKEGLPIDSKVGEIRFDRSGLFNGHLFVMLWTEPSAEPGFYKKTHIMTIDNDSKAITLRNTIGNNDNETMLIMDFSPGLDGYLFGAYMFDLNGGNNTTSMYHLDETFSINLLDIDLEPNDRSDIDIWAMEFDTTNLYDSNLILADSDENSDMLTVIYQLLPDLSWHELTVPISASSMYYRDMCISKGGSFRDMLYVTDQVTNSVMSVDPNGVHILFASNFSQVESITVDDTGEFIYISDYNGIWRIRAITTVIGPQIIMQEPKVPLEKPFTNEEGLVSLRIFWNEAVQFDNNDVEILNEDSQSVDFSASGSGSQFMIIAFGEMLLNDKYTITIHDTVASALTGDPIDGDEDGLAGGDAVIVMEHRKRSDFDNDNDVDFTDLANFALNWLWHE